MGLLRLIYFGLFNPCLMLQYPIGVFLRFLIWGALLDGFKVCSVTTSKAPQKTFLALVASIGPLGYLP